MEDITILEGRMLAESETCGVLLLILLKTIVTLLSPHGFSGQLTWLVYMIGSAIGGRVSFNTSDDHDAMDGELVCR